MDFGRISRRHLLQGGAALTLGAAAGIRPAFAAETTIGFIYVGSRDDYGYNQAHAQGAAALKKIPGVKVVEEEKVPETDAVQKTMESMINLDGATLLFPTSFGYFDPHMLKMANKYPKCASCTAAASGATRIRRTSAATSATSTRPSTSPASSPATRPRANKLGFVAAKPIPQVLRNINAFTLGARLVNPKATTQVIFTGDWSMPVKEAEATNSLIDQGVDVLTCHVDGPKIIVENAETPRRLRLRLSRQPVAARAQGLSHRRRVELGSALSEVRQDDRRRREHPELLRGGLKEGIVKISPYGEAVSAERARKADAAKAKFMSADGFVIFKGGAERQQGQDGHRGRHRSRPDGSSSRRWTTSSKA